MTLHPKETYRMKCTWDKKGYAWYVWRNGWVLLKRLPNSNPVYGGLKLSLGTNRGYNNPFLGTINLNRCYIKIGEKLWWEGAKGAYHNSK